MDFSTRNSFISALRVAQNYTPETGKMDELALELIRNGFCTSRLSDGWRRIALPADSFQVQLELGRSINPNELICTLHNEVITSKEYHPTELENYTSLVLDLDEVDIPNATALISEFYHDALAKQ